jgi:hypothetical protein
VVLFKAALAYFLPSKTIVASQGKDAFLDRAIGRDLKG